MPLLLQVLVSTLEKCWFFARFVLHLLAQVSGVELLQVCGSGCNLWTQFVSLAQLLEVGQALNHLTLNPGPNL